MWALEGMIGLVGCPNEGGRVLGVRGIDVVVEWLTGWQLGG